MKIKVLAIFIFAAMLVPCAVACEQHSIKQQSIQPEVLIPEGMPITLDVSLDEHDHETKYNIRRKVGPDVDRVVMRVLTVGPDQNIDTEPGMVAELMTARESDHASVAWPVTHDVRRLIVIVERVETSSGVWVLDNQDGHIEPKAIIERGRDALPKATFIKKA
jgi:hypothetical protein